MASIYKSDFITRFFNFATVLFMGFIVAACGGGGGSPGVISGSGGQSKAAVTVTLSNFGGASTNVLTLSSPLVASAKVLDTKGQPLPNALVSFSLGGNNAVLSPSAATALTNFAGIATITISIRDLATALSQVGAADAITATVLVGSQVLSNSAPFSLGVSTAGTKAALTLELVDATGKAADKVTLSSPVTGRAKVVDGNGQPLKGATVTFALASATAVLTPSGGTALTNADGIATTTISLKDLATALAQAGSANSLTATVSVNGQTLIATAPFTIGATSITLRLVSPNSPPPNTNTVNIKAYETTQIQVDVLSDGILYTDQQVTVNFSSACAGTKADLPASATTVNGRAQVVYKDKGCSTTDTVTISAAGAKSITAIIVVAPPVAASIGFVSAVPADKAIVIKGAGGTGRTETAVLTFQALDTAGQPLPNVTVSFAVNSTQPVSLQATSAITGTDGKVTVSVNSGTMPTTFRVIATLPTGQSTISDSITVTTGQPVQAAFSLSASEHNIEGWSYDNIQSKVTILVADQSGNPVADGTPVVFQTDSGAVGSSSVGGCMTKNGGCTVDFRSQAPRFGLNNSAGKRAGLATINVSSTSALYTLQGQIGIFLSGSFADNVYYADGTNTRVDPFRNSALATGTCGVYGLALEINDGNFNPMPYGTKIEAINVDKVTVQEIIPKTVVNAGPRTSTGVATLVPGNMAARQGTVHVIPIKTPDSCLPGGSVYTETGTFTIKVTTPIGNVTAYPFSLQYPIAAPAVTCTPPQVLQNGSCVIPPSPSMSISLSGTVVDATHSPTVSATVRDANGTPVANTLVTFTLNDSALAKFSPPSGTALTNAAGVATIQLVKVIPGGQGAATVTATATVTGTQVSASASFAIGAAGTPTPVAVNFVGAVPADKSIVIKGSGGTGRTEVALLTFSVVDSANTGVGGVTVNFSLQTDLSLPADARHPSFNGATTATGVTDQSGNVTVSLNSGTSPTTVRVVATVNSVAPPIGGISDTVTITTGQPSQYAISMSLAKYYVEGWNWDNTTNNVLVLLADQFGGAVADGTQVVFTTNEGAIYGSGGAKCLTGQTNDGPGACHVTWRSQNPRTPGNLGVGTIVASATTSSGSISVTQRFYDSGSTARVYQVGNFDSPGTTVRAGAANVITLPGSFDGNCQAQTVRIEVVDVANQPPAPGNENPMPEGTTLSAVNTVNASAVAFPSSVARNGLPIPNPNPAHRGTVHDLTVAPVGCKVGGLILKSGFFDLAITTPLGTATYFRVSLGTFHGD